ncbi:MAG: hypothetical protein K6U03_03345 [Firmicutes bacterium]|nr:hypothetical protein [Bacillota bacterium]
MRLCFIGCEVMTREVAAIAAERFLLVRPGESIAPSFDREILRAAPAGG